MENKDKGIYGDAEDFGKKDKALQGGENTIYGEAEDLGSKNTEDQHNFMADSGDHNPKVDEQIKYSPVSSDQTDGVYTQAAKLGEKEKAFEETDESIYSEAEDLSKDNVTDMHSFMADSDGKK
ncbi:MAG: hypothetical protein CVU92_04795 [Firmicutes bacterium HGW-Firmicutes-17]|jgi:hypothetical protein|nr:MAG: hypothetical protein CVU92_04795 [Firmicutes bacterium HGW-Firmicutes-17]